MVYRYLREYLSEKIEKRGETHKKIKEIMDVEFLIKFLNSNLSYSVEIFEEKYWKFENE